MEGKREKLKARADEVRKEDEKGYLFKDIPELEVPLLKILEGLKQKIENGDFDLIIGDDASGRIPTLVIRKVVAKMYESRGFKTPETLFFAGGGSTVAHSANPKIRDRTVDIAVILSKNQYKKALVVTDTIVTGKSLAPVMGALRANGIPFEIAAVGIDPTDEIPLNDLKNVFESRLGGEIHHGVSHKTPGVYGDPQRLLGGVYKEAGDLYAKRIPTDLEGNIETPPVIVAEARKDIDILAKSLLEKMGEK